MNVFWLPSNLNWSEEMSLKPSEEISGKKNEKLFLHRPYGEQWEREVLLWVVSVSGQCGVKVVVVDNASLSRESAQKELNHMYLQSS